MIRKSGNKYILFAKSTGRRLGSFNSIEAAKKREMQIQYFKKLGHGSKR